MPQKINNPPIESGLPVQGEFAEWPKPWGNWFTQAWQMLFLGQQWPSITTTQTYQIQPSDSVVLVDGDVTVTLPDITRCGPKRITVKVINAGAGTRTVDGGAVNIDGAGSVTTTQQYMHWDFVTNPTFTEWHVV